MPRPAVTPTLFWPAVPSPEAVPFTMASGAFNRWTVTSVNPLVQSALAAITRLSVCPADGSPCLSAGALPEGVANPTVAYDCTRYGGGLATAVAGSTLLTPGALLLRLCAARCFRRRFAAAAAHSPPDSTLSQPLPCASGDCTHAPTDGHEYLSAFNYICATNADATRGGGFALRARAAAAAGAGRPEPKRITALDAAALAMSKK